MRGMQLTRPASSILQQPETIFHLPAKQNTCSTSQICSQCDEPTPNGACTARCRSGHPTLSSSPPERNSNSSAAVVTSYLRPTTQSLIVEGYTWRYDRAARIMLSTAVCETSASQGSASAGLLVLAPPASEGGAGSWARRVRRIANRMMGWIECKHNGHNIVARRLQYLRLCRGRSRRCNPSPASRSFAAVFNGSVHDKRYINHTSFVAKLLHRHPHMLWSPFIRT